MTLGGAAPDAVFEPVFEGIVEASFEDRATCADLFGHFDADSVTREKRGGGLVVAIAGGHPCGFGFHGGEGTKQG